jgi:hypothetical protein
MREGTPTLPPWRACDRVCGVVEAGSILLDGTCSETCWERLSLYLVSLESVRLSVQLSGSSSLGADAGMAGFSLSLARINYDVGWVLGWF